MGKKYKRLGFTASESAEVWDRWQRGEGLNEIARALSKRSSSIFSHLRPTGGIRPMTRRRLSLLLTFDEREEISRGIVLGLTMRSMARSLRRSPSTISREIKRGSTKIHWRKHQYLAAEAQKKALIRKANEYARGSIKTDVPVIPSTRSRDSIKY